MIRRYTLLVVLVAFFLIEINDSDSILCKCTYNIAADYEQLLSMDLQIRDIVLNRIHYYLERAQVPDRIRNYRFSGSLSEGCYTPALFFPDSRFKDGIQRSVDIDVEYEFLRLPVQYKSCIVEHSGLGFVKIQSAPKSECFCQKCFYHDLLEEHLVNDQGYILPYQLKEIIFNETEIENSKAHLQGLLGLIFDMPHTSFSFTHCIKNITKATFYSSFTVYFNNEIFSILSVDIGLIAKLEWQTEFIKTWMRRPRFWPNIKDLSAVINVTFLIAKTSHKEKYLPESQEFRYSFAHIERKIVSLQSGSQRLVYYIAKTIFNRWVKPIDPNVITSYLIKNVMLWTCEEYTPEHDIWGNFKETKIVLRAVTLLYLKLLEYLQASYMPYYFIPELNIFEHLSNKTMVKLTKRIKRIVEDIEAYLTNDLVPLKSIFKSAKYYVLEFFDIADIIHHYGSFGLVKRKNAANVMAKTFYRDVVDED